MGGASGGVKECTEYSVIEEGEEYILRRIPLRDWWSWIIFEKETRHIRQVQTRY